MKPSTLLLSVLAVSLLASSEAQFFGAFPFGAFPFAGPGLFGRIFPPIIPTLRPGLFLRNGLGFFPFGGKRDTEAVGAALPLVDESQRFKALCSVSTLTSILICNGLEKNSIFECGIEPRGNVTRFKLVLDDLIVERPVTREPVDSVTLFSRRSDGKFTYISPVNRTQEVLTVFGNKQLEQNGFFVKDADCFQKFVKLVGDIPSSQFKISLFASP